jgi:hypothetical protein
MIWMLMVCHVECSDADPLQRARTSESSSWMNLCISVAAF